MRGAIRAESQTAEEICAIDGQRTIALGTIRTHDPHERERYHQRYPAKLLTDWGTATLAGDLLWWRRWLLAIAIGFIRSITITAVFLSGRLDNPFQGYFR